MKRALIIGHHGQDGSLLCSLLEKKGYEVCGVGKSASITGPSFPVPQVPPTDVAAASALLEDFRPDEIYFLAAYHHSSQDRPLEDTELLVRSREAHWDLLLVYLEALRRTRSPGLFFYAASSRIFGQPESPLQTEDSPMRPVCAYGITKAAGLMTCRLYREKYGLPVYGGILFNHESALRKPGFLFKKVLREAVALARGTGEGLVLGNLESRCDWGYAPEYVQAMQTMLLKAPPADYIVATGELHSVRDLVEEAFGALGLDWQKHVQVAPGTVETGRPLAGDSSKLRLATGWAPVLSFSEMVRQLLIDEGAGDLLRRHPQDSIS